MGKRRFQTRPHGFLSKLGLAVLGGVIVGLTVEILKGFPLTLWAVDGVSVGVGWFLKPVAVGRWRLVLFWLLLGGLVFLGVRRVLRPHNSTPIWHAYQGDEFLGVRWQWGYLGNMLDPDSFVAFCPRCACQLVMERAGAYRVIPETELSCTECSFRTTLSGTPREVLDRVGRLAERALRTGDWTKRLESARNP